MTTADLGMAVTAFTVSGGNDVTLTFSPMTDSDGLNQLMLNGFELSAVPEPSSTALLGLGGLALDAAQTQELICLRQTMSDEG